MRKYLNRLADGLLDDHNLAVEFFLAWIAVMVTILACGTVAYYVFGIK